MCLDVHRHCLSCRVARIRHQGSQPEDSIFEPQRAELGERPEKARMHLSKLLNKVSTVEPALVLRLVLSLGL
jgi:hypothetical protein